MRRLFALSTFAAAALLLVRCGETTSSTADAGGGGGEDAAVQPADAAGGAPDGGVVLPCDPVGMSGCPTGQKCTFTNFTTMEVGCGTAGGLGDYEACQNDSQCGPGYFCAVVGGGGAACHRFCNTNPDCPTDGGLELCSVVMPPATTPKLCMRVTTCDLLLQDCPDPQGCYPTGGGLSICLQGGNKATGEPCANGLECAKGNLCVGPVTDAGSDVRCRAVCDPAPDAGTTCAVGRCNKLTSYPVGACF